MKHWMKLVVLTSAFVASASLSFAALLNVNPTFPKVNFSTTASTAVNYTYTATNGSGLFSVSAPVQTMIFTSLGGTQPFSVGSTVQISIVVSNTGALVGGVAGADLVLQGTVSRIVGGVTNTYSGVLLTGEVTAFGFSKILTTSYFDFQFTPTGGLLQNLFCGQIGVTLTSQGATFTGSFASNFHGPATKGVVGALDHTPPTIICPTDMVVECHSTNDSGSGGAYVSYPTPVVTDNCDPNPTIVCTPASGDFFDLPPPPANSSNHVVTCVATDVAGNSNTCTFNITVQDTLPPAFADTNNPMISCSLCVPIILTNDPGVCYATLTFPTPEAIDFCCPLIISTIVSAVDENGAVINLIDLGNGMLQGQFPVGTNVSVVVTTASDGRGNSAQHLCAVVVMDTEPPVINCPTDQIVECTGGQIFFQEPIVYDNCPNVTYSCAPTNGSALGIGSHQIVCTVIDCSGNTNQCTFYVTVQDTTPPTISCPANVTVECGQPTDPSSTGVATASDICDSSPTLTFTDAVSGNSPQIITRTWTATDNSGNSNSCVQIITIQDTTPPVITCPPDKQLQCGDSTDPANTGTATAIDTCSGNGNVAITFTDVATPANCTGNAGIDRTWKATDAGGNSSTCIQHITFVDTTAPTITTVPTGSNLGCNPTSLPDDASVKALVTSTDNCGTPTVNVSHVDGTSGCTVTRTFTVTATDACGNAATPQTVIYTWTADTTAPTITSVPTGSNLGCNPATLPTDASVKALVTATDNSGVVTVTVTHVDSGTPCAPVRTFSITAADGCGNAASAAPVVYTWTADVTPPVLTLPADVQLQCGNPTDPSNTGFATAADGCGGSATITYVDQAAATNCTGKAGINRTWTAVDGCGNSANGVQHITFVDTSAPAIACPGAVTVVVSGTNNVSATNSVIAAFLHGVTVIDNCSGGVTIANNAPSSFPLGTNTVTFTATDACGNSATCQSKVIVVATTPICEPIIMAPFYCQHHFDGFGSCQFATFEGNLTLTDGDQPIDFRTASNAPVSLTVTLGSNSPVVLYSTQLVCSVYKDCSGGEAWQFTSRNPWEKVIFRFIDNQKYNALMDPKLPSSAATGYRNVGKLSTVSIGADQTRFFYAFQYATQPITIVVDGIALVSISNNVARSSFPISQSGATIQVCYPDRLIPGNVIQWYATGDPSKVSSTNLIYSQQASATGNSTATYFNEGGVFEIQVPVSNIPYSYKERVSCVQFTLGKAGVTSKIACGSFCQGPFNIMGGCDWSFGRCSDFEDEFDQGCWHW
ncbi:MAG: HYR domain-containing protein [Verrucomicrobiota bacterium]